MDVKDLRTETALSERNNDGSKYPQGGIALQCNRNKSYQDIGSNPLAKTEPAPVRPCAVIGPDRVLPPTASNDAFLKRGLVDPWPSSDSVYRRPPEYPHKILNNQNPSRNISPRQTFQENMQRIMVPPTYNAARHSDDANFSHIQDRNVAIAKSVKPNMAPEAKYCDVPYAVNTLTNEPKNVRDPEMYVPSVNSPLTRTAPHGWPPGGVNVHPSRTYAAHELYQYQQYPSCAGQRPTVIPMSRPQRTIQEEAYAYPDHYYQDPSARFKPYPPAKERHQQPRFEYINYPSQFHPTPTLQPHKYDSSKSGQPHPYSVYPHLKYLDSRVPDTMEAYQRPTNQQPHYNIQFRNQVIHPTYAPVPANSSQNKVHPYPPDGTVKSMSSNKLPYDSGSKMYIDYENSRTKPYPMADNYYVNEMGRVHPVKNQMVMPNYSPIGSHSIPSQQYYRKDNSQMKSFEYIPHFRNFDPAMNNNAMMRHAPLFSPNTLAISPSDSSTSMDTLQTQGSSQEDCGYVSQSSTASVRSIDSGLYRYPHEYYKRCDFRYGPILGSSPLHTLAKPGLNSNSGNCKDKQKQIDVRQFLQMWNEGEEENAENNNSKEIVIQTGSSDTISYPKHVSNQDQLYVLGLVNVPSEELGKYEHIQKISKLPENIKGYNNLELLSQFEEAIESSNKNGFKSISKEYQKLSKDNSPKQLVEMLPRPVSPLDVEAKISQSVIHKEVGCNFEIRPCSPKMLNVELAAPAQNILGERVIEKVTNPLSKKVKSPITIKPDENSNCHTIKRQENTFAINDNPSCKMIRSPYPTNNMDSVKTNYSLQDLEINSGVCLASLPRLDNEIELNFPEVNQQFINANKKDDNSTIKNGIQSNLDKDSGLLENKLVKTNMETRENSLMAEDSEKIFTKLSKYRKLKTSPVNYSEKNQLTMAVRTDSVIIKNPENIKNIEDKLLENSLNVPMNLSSQSSVCDDLSDIPIENKEHDVDIALDFSLNKSGNDLPIIDSEKDELIKSLATHLPHLSCESHTNASEPHNIIANINENIELNSKNTIFKCIKPELNKDICMDNNQDATMDVETNFEDTMNSVNVETDTHLSDLGNVYTDSLKYENASSVNEYLKHDSNNANTNTETSERLHTCNDSETVGSEEHTWDTKYEKDDSPATSKDNIRDDNPTTSNDNNCNIRDNNPTTSNDNTCNIRDENLTMSNDNICNEENPAQDFTIMSKYEASGEIMQLFSSENDDNNLVDGSEIDKSELVQSSQIKDDFENDEISASLEKLFQENNDNTVLSNRGNGSTDTSVSTCMKTHCCHQSKELYSPWIQKLLTYSEGLCNESTEKNSIKPFSKENLKPEKNITDLLKVEQSHNMEIEQNNEITGDLLKVEQSHNMEIEQNNEKTGSLHYTENEICTTKTTEDLNTNAKLKTKLESITTKHQSDTVSDTVKDPNVSYIKNEKNPVELNLVAEITETSNTPKNQKSSKINRSSHEFITNVNYQINHELDVCATELPTVINLKGCLQDTKQDSKFVKELVNDQGVDNLSVETMENKNETAYIETHIAQEEALLVCDRRKDVSQPKNIIQEDLRANNILTSFISSDPTEHQTDENQNGESLIQNTNMYSDVVGIFDCSKIVSKFNNVIQKDLIQSNPESLSNNILDNYINVLDNSTNVPENRHKLEEIRSEESFIEEVIKNRDNICEIIETLDSDKAVCKNDSIVKKELKTFENLASNVSNICSEHQTKEIRSQECLMRICESDADENSRIFDCINVCKKYNIAQKECNNSNLESLSGNVSNMYPGYETKEIQSGECLIKTCEKDADETLGTCDSNNFVCKNDNIAQEESNHSNLENLSHIVSDICTGHQREENKSGKCLIEDVTKNDDIATDETSETFDRNNIKCYNNNIAQAELQNPNLESFSNSDSNNSTGNQTSVTLETFDTSNIVRKLNNKPQKHLNKPSLEILPHGASDSSTEHTIEENRKEDDKIENCTKNRDSNKADTSETSDNSSTDQKLNSTKLNNITRLEFNDPNLEKLSNNIFDNCTGNTIHGKQNEKIVVENNDMLIDINNDADVISKVCDASINNHGPNIQIQESRDNSILENLPNCDSDKCSEHQNKENSLLTDISIITDNKQGIVPLQKCDNNLKSKRNQDIENDQVQIVDRNKASNSNKQENPHQDSSVKRRLTLKRSFSDSALDSYKNGDANNRQVIEHTPLIWPSKRQRMFEFEHSEQHVFHENLRNLIQNNRRNSVSSFYNEENVSFCILIDNDCIIAEENEEEKICYAEISEDCITEINTTNEEDDEDEVICCSQENQLAFSESVILEYENEKSIQESWLDDVACVETVVSDDIVEDVIISSQVSPTDGELSEYEDSGIYNCDISGLINEVKSMNEVTLPDNVSKIVNTHHIDVDRTLYDNNTHDIELGLHGFAGESSKMIISESNSRESSPSPDHIETILPDDTTISKIPEDKENIFVANITMQHYDKNPEPNSSIKGNDENYFSEEINQTDTSCNLSQDKDKDGVDSYEFSIDNIFSFNEHGEDMNYTISSSPEVSSTTSEEKSSSILLKITNHNGSRISEVNEFSHNRPRCKFTEKKEYSNSYGGFPKRPLMTKAAQKYIPPLKETIGDLKVKLSLPQQKLLKLKQLKLTKNEPKVNKQSNAVLMIPKKPKPNFEDVLKSIDEVQIKLHKEKNKKVKNIVPKVVIKKNINGSHYTSLSNKDTFNPDLTGRKWQPWVFLEKNHFIDKMAIKNNRKAVFSHRKNTYVLAEKFKKYKSVSNCSAKFVISQPKAGGSSRGQLKYTIRLKHTY